MIVPIPAATSGANQAARHADDCGACNAGEADFPSARDLGAFISFLGLFCGGEVLRCFEKAFGEGGLGIGEDLQGELEGGG